MSDQPPSDLERISELYESGKLKQHEFDLLRSRSEQKDSDRSGESGADFKSRESLENVEFDIVRRFRSLTPENKYSTPENSQDLSDININEGPIMTVLFHYGLGFSYNVYFREPIHEENFFALLPHDDWVLDSDVSDNVGLPYVSLQSAIEFDGFRGELDQEVLEAEIRIVLELLSSVYGTKPSDLRART